MSNLKLLCKILHLKGMKITRFDFKHRDKELHLAVKPYKNGCRCPHCGRRGRMVWQAAEPRRWEDLTLMGLKVLLWYTPREILCPTHARVQETIPWADAYSRISYRLEWRLCALCQIMTQKAAAEILGMAPSTLSDLLHRIIDRFHVVKALNEAVDEVRKEQWRALDNRRPQGDQGAALAAWHALQKSHQGPYPLSQQPAQRQPPYPPRLGAQGRV